MWKCPHQMQTRQVEKMQYTDESTDGLSGYGFTATQQARREFLEDLRLRRHEMWSGLHDTASS